MARYYEYPEYLGKGDGQLNHWISFESFAFSRGTDKGNKKLDIALYIPADALQTSYKSDYSAVSLGQISGRVLEGMQKVGGGASIQSVIDAQTKALTSEGVAMGIAKKKLAGEKGMAIIEQMSGSVRIIGQCLCPRAPGEIGGIFPGIFSPGK